MRSTFERKDFDKKHIGEKMSLQRGAGDFLETCFLRWWILWIFYHGMKITIFSPPAFGKKYVWWRSKVKTHLFWANDLFPTLFRWKVRESPPENLLKNLGWGIGMKGFCPDLFSVFISIPRAFSSSNKKNMFVRNGGRIRPSKKGRNRPRKSGRWPSTGVDWLKRNHSFL